MENIHKLARWFSEELTNEISHLPSDFFNTFHYTTTGNNLTHPVTLGAISHIIWKFPKVNSIGIDVRLNNRGGTKFQPDIVGFDNRLNPVVVIDYESPNSSDARVPIKDWESYANWLELQKQITPYFVVTTLPTSESPNWELRWVAKDQCNSVFSGERDKIRRNPFEFWYGHYRSQSGKYNLNGIHMINIDSGFAKVVLLDSI